MVEKITFRSHLLETITDFSESCEMGAICSPLILVELIVALSHYTEEGIKLSPDVYLCNDINSILKLIPEHGEIKIGEANMSETAVQEILKNTAPLAIDGWKIYLEGKNDKISYGLFRDSLNPLAVPVEEILLSNVSDDVKVVQLHQIADGCVEIRNHRGGTHHIITTHLKETAPAPTQHLENLVDMICDQVEADQKDSVKTFIKTHLITALTLSHGALIAVAPTNNIPKFLSDSIPLVPPIDFYQTVSDVISKRLPLHTLRAQGSLLKGMINCDGIVLFSRDAKLLAYNAFLSTLPEQKGPAGGARQRAFNGLCVRLGKGIVAAFIQSQDGWTDFRKVEK